MVATRVTRRAVSGCAQCCTGVFGDVDVGAGCGVKQPRRGGSGGAVVVGLSWWWSGCRGQVVGGGFGDGGSGAGFVDEGFVVRACGDEGGEGEVVDASWFPACAGVDEVDRVLGE